MTPQYYSKKKKTERLSFTITPALKNDLNEFVNNMRKENPNNVEFKSLSSFCYYTIKDALDLRKKGIDIKSLKSIPDKKTSNFYDQISFRAVIPFFELSIVPNKYSDDIIKSQNLLFTFRKWIQKDINSEKRRDFLILIDKLKNFLISNNLTKELRIDILDSNKKNHFKVVIEYIGLYKNLHYNNLKGMAGILGVLGFKIEDFTLSDEDLYARFDLVETELSTRSDSAKRERKALLVDNLRFLVNYHRIINDDEMYLWMKIAESKDIAIKFTTPIAFKNYLNKVIEDIKRFAEKEDFLLNILKYFHALHWISIEDSEALSFRIKNFKMPFSNKKKSIEDDLKSYIEQNYNEDKVLKKLINKVLKEKPSLEEDYIYNVIEPHATIRKEGDIYYLEKN